jgi:hypothetical protein
MKGGRAPDARTLRAVLVSVLLATTAVQARGADAWESLGPARIGAGFDEVSRSIALTCKKETARQTCAVSLRAPIAFAGVPATSIEASFDDGRLQRIRVSLAVGQYEELLRILTARYGEGEDHGFVAIAGMSGDFTAGVFVWRTAALSLVLEQYAGKIDRCALTYGSESSMAGLVRKVNAYARGARRDL